MFNANEFNKFIIKNSVVGFSREPIIFNSGRICHCYVNWRSVTSQVALMQQLIEYLLVFLKHKKIFFDCLFGVPEGMSKVGLLAQYTWAQRQHDYLYRTYPLAMGRAQPKAHGDSKDRYFIGIPEGQVIVLEDVVTTGSSLTVVIDYLLQLGVSVTACVVFTDRNEKNIEGFSVAKQLARKGVAYYTMSNVYELLPQVAKHHSPPHELLSLVEDYYQQYGVMPINLTRA